MTFQPSQSRDAEAGSAIIMNDRFCRNCDANLLGVQVEREEHYNLLVARCQECGTIEPLVEYPRVGSWPARWLMLFSAFWFCGVVAAAIGFPLALFGGVMGVSYESSWRFQNVLQAQYEAWLREQNPDLSQVPYWQMPDQFPEFWESTTVSEIVRKAGGIPGILTLEVLPLALIPLAGAIFVGMFWSIVLLHARAHARVLFVASHFAFVAGIGLLINWAGENGSTFHLGEATFNHVTFPLATVLHLLMMGGLIFGVLIGRKTVRQLIRILLPPRLRSPLASLWIADGLNQGAERSS